MCVPGHDQRDWEFAKKYSISIKQVIESDKDKTRWAWKKLMDKESDKFLDDIASVGFEKKRREKMEALGPQAWTPRGRNRVVSGALRAYAALTTSAARGAVRDVSQTER